MLSPITYIKKIQDRGNYIQGCCWCMHKELLRVFKDVTPYYDGNHIISKIGDRFYDITGEVEQGRYIPFYGSYVAEKEARVIAGWEQFCEKINL